MQETPQAVYLREQANLCRRLADRIADEPTIATLRELAEQFDAQAAQAETRPVDGMPHPRIEGSGPAQE